MASLCDNPDEMPADPAGDPEKTAYILLDSFTESADAATATATAMTAQAYAMLALAREVRQMRHELQRRRRS